MRNDFRVRNFAFTDERRGGEAPDGFERALDLRGEDELIAGLDRLAEARLVDADEVEASLIVRNDVRAQEAEDACRLRERLDDHDARHDRPAGEMPRNEQLVAGDILERTDPLAGVVLEYAVDEQKGVAMRQPLDRKSVV